MARQPFPNKIACRTSPFLWNQSFRISLRNFWCRRSAAAVGAQEEISGRTQVSSSEFGAGFDNRSGKVCQTERSEDIPCPASSCPNRNIACKTVYFLPLLSCTVGVIKLRVRRQRGFPPPHRLSTNFRKCTGSTFPPKKAASRIYARRRGLARCLQVFHGPA